MYTLFFYILATHNLQHVLLKNSSKHDIFCSGFPPKYGSSFLWFHQSAELMCWMGTPSLHSSELKKKKGSKSIVFSLSNVLFDSIDNHYPSIPKNGHVFLRIEMMDTKGPRILKSDSKICYITFFSWSVLILKDSHSSFGFLLSTHPRTFTLYHFPLSLNRDECWATTQLTSTPVFS